MLSILSIALWIAYGAVAAALLLTSWRLLIGPTLPDRIMALDKLYVNAVALLVLLGIQLGSTAFFEAAVLIALLGFIGTVAVCKYITRGDIIE